LSSRPMMIRLQASAAMSGRLSPLPYDVVRDS
jgi:hypothetical protein